MYFRYLEMGLARPTKKSPKKTQRLEQLSRGGRIFGFLGAFLAERMAQRDMVILKETKRSLVKIAPFQASKRTSF